MIDINSTHFQNKSLDISLEIQAPSALQIIRKAPVSYSNPLRKGGDTRLHPGLAGKIYG